MMDKIDNVALTLKANIYFDGKVVSHTIHTKEGARKTVGIIYPGAYKFDTGAPERMDILAGECRVKQAGESDWKAYGAGTFFKVPGKSLFEIAVDKGQAEYLCSFE
jgi:purine/pyrimidine-nucleoside phosphorylase